jgi:DNA adenine methylase
MGSKNRIAKHNLPIMLAERKPDQWWVEPFVGGANVIDKVDGKRIGADISPYLIDALIAIRDCVSDLPKNNQEFTEENYRELRKNDTYKYKGYAGFAFSYSGKWLGGWRRDCLNKRDYVNESYKNAINQSPLLQGVKFVNESYLYLQIPDNSLIYCDPPYKGTTKYKNNFNHSEFWDWCRQKVKEGHIVFVSEYNAPDDFECVWQKEIVSSLTKDTGSKKGVEKLFRYKRQLPQCFMQLTS